MCQLFWEPMMTQDKEANGLSSVLEKWKKIIMFQI